MLALRSVEIAVDSHGLRGSEANDSTASDGAVVSLTCASQAWRVLLHPQRAEDAQHIAAEAANGGLVAVIGDLEELLAAPLSSPCANAIAVRIDLRDSTITLATSVTGLPPVFIFREGSAAVIGSPFIPRAARGKLRLDLDGIADTLRWGHPLDGRTLFEQLRVVCSFVTVTVDSGGNVTESRTDPWAPTDDLRTLRRRDIVHEQMAAFAAAAGRLRTEGAFLSLSGGLDSRTALVGLISQGHSVPCVTMAGSPHNLDARLAKAFCDAHGLRHVTILLDERFDRRAPQLLLESAELTGGISCLSQTADLFLYENVPFSFAARITGNLGNQVGRGGFESLSAYQPHLEILSGAVREKLGERPATPWFMSRLAGNDYGAVLFGEEVHYWSISNYAAGSARARQLTPYADYRLMSLSRAAFARDRHLQQATWRSLRLRDLRHRLAGTRRSLSFQRQFLAQHDGRGGHVPLNWGWRAARGRSVVWSVSAMASATDAAMIKLSRKSTALRPMASWLSRRLQHRSSLVDWRRLLKGPLRSLTMDVLFSRGVLDSGVFDSQALARIVGDHFRGIADYHHTVSRALEIGLGIATRAVVPPERKRE
jgi:hypothetical protein